MCGFFFKKNKNELINVERKINMNLSKEINWWIGEGMFYCNK